MNLTKTLLEMGYPVQLSYAYYFYIFKYFIYFIYLNLLCIFIKLLLEQDTLLLDVILE